jgi:hypothetical protein
VYAGSWIWAGSTESLAASLHIGAAHLYILSFSCSKLNISGPYKQHATPRGGIYQVSRATPWQETYLAQTHFHKTETTNKYPHQNHQNILVTRTQVKTLHKQQTNNTQTNLDLRKTTLGYGFHFQHRNPRMLQIESFAQVSRRTLVCAEYGYPKGSLITNS